MMQASCSRIDAARWHFQHGPIDLIITVDGKADAIARALDSAWSRFQQLLPEMVDELALLRQAVRSDWAFEGAVLAASCAIYYADGRSCRLGSRRNDRIFFVRAGHSACRN
jgi:hypothetical protein